MAKFKVGDKVVFSKKLVKDERYDGFTYLPNIMPKGIEFEVVDVNPDSMGVWYGVKSKSDGRVGVSSEMIELIEQPRREFIVIHQNGNVMTAEHRVNRDVIKSAKATCAPSDTFDFDTGAKLAFDRLMGREEPKPEPQPAHRFKVGDRVETEYGIGEIVYVCNDDLNVPYLVYNENWVGCSGYLAKEFDVQKYGRHCKWFCERLLHPAPEPPEYVPHIGDRVVTKHGNGTIMDISTKEKPPILVIHDDWHGGHDADRTRPNFKFSGCRCYWFYKNEINPFTGASDV